MTDEFELLVITNNNDTHTHPHTHTHTHLFNDPFSRTTRSTRVSQYQKGNQSGFY